MKKKIFTIGADPEICLADEKGKLKSAIGLVEGTKHEPFPLSNGGNIQRDNVAVEFGVVPTQTKEEFIEVITSTMALVLDYLPKGMQFTNFTAVDFPEGELDNDEAKEFGCDMDFNAWKGGAPNVLKKSDDCRSDGTLRSFGGHVHLGRVREDYPCLANTDDTMEVVRVLDCTLGVWGLQNDNSPGNKRRRELYGKAGCFRPTNYGVEYRVLSNFWIFHPSLIGGVYDMSEIALKIVDASLVDKLFGAVHPELVQGALNNENDKGPLLWSYLRGFIRKEGLR